MSKNSMEWAKGIIQGIRTSRHVDDIKGIDGDANARTLVRALEMLSKELYSKPTHFILEMIQNADDNDYPQGVTPTLDLTYQENGILWVGCNEVGFNESNVWAICEIADSTKKIDAHRRGYIGEKGIGFKAVFRVATEVWISSGPFTFMFRRDDPLGMIVPIWSHFVPSHSLRQTTMFRLRIPNLQDQEVVKNHLLALDRNLLLFLRKLRRIDVMICPGNRADYQHKFSIHRTDTELHDFRETVLFKIVQGSTNTESVKFLVMKQTEARMPSDTKRMEVDESDLLIAFPIRDARNGITPALTNQMVHNFLPIRAFGFSFLLQADFLLSASREDILVGNAWNNALVQASRDLFIKGVRAFNKSDILRYTWPKYLQSVGSAYGTIMEGFLTSLVNSLRANRVLYSQAGSLETPSSLLIVPLKFTDGATPPRPLLANPAHYNRYVANFYASSDLTVLSVRHQTNENFIQMLDNMVRMQAFEFRLKPLYWHSRLAEAINDIGYERVRHLSIIPLRDGQWVASSGNTIFFPDVSEGVFIPDRLTVNVVSPDAVSCSSRRRLFTGLGVKSLDPTRVCQLIVDQHRTLKDTDWVDQLDVLISHLWYIFSHGRNLRLGLSNLRIAIEGMSSTAMSDDVYMDIAENRFCITNLVPAQSGIYQLIHHDYLTVGPLDQRHAWLDWLKYDLGIATLPKLNHNNSVTLSREFAYIMRHHPSKVWLEMLKEHWNDYSITLNDRTWFGNTTVGFSLQRILSRSLVHCTNGNRAQLETTYLATDDIMREPLAASHLPILDVPSPTDLGWNGPSIDLGFRTRENLRMYLDILSNIAGLDNWAASSNNLNRLYEGVHRHFETDPLAARNYFSSKALIRVGFHWYKLNQCRWQAPSCLKYVIPLNDSYPDMRMLFVKNFGVKNASATDIIEELVDLTQSDEDYCRAKELLLVLGRHGLGDNNLRRSIDRLSKANAIPLQIDGEHCLSSCLSRGWFIVDRERYRRYFQGKVWLLDFSIKELDELQKILSHLQLQSHYLSACIQEETITAGTATFQQSVTSELQAKARYISLLGDVAERDSALHRLSSIQVWASPKLTLRRKVPYDTHSGVTYVYGEDDIGRVVISEDGGSLRITIDDNSLQSANFPWSFVCQSLATFFQMVIEEILDRANVLEAASVPIDGSTSAVYESTDRDEDRGISEVYELTDRAEDREIASEHGNIFASRVNTNSASSDGEGRTEFLTAPNSSHAAGRTWHRTNYGQGLSDPAPRLQIIDVSDVQAAADRFMIDSIDVVSAPSVHPTVSGANELLNTNGAATRMPRSTGSNRRLSSSRNISFSEGSSRIDSFDVSDMRSALPDTETLNTVHRMQERTGTLEQEIGYGGELFIYGILTRKFNASNDCWTSKMRSRHGLSAFPGHEGACADFTVTDRVVASHVTSWLIDSGYEAASQGYDRNVTYHIEVKTTLGQCSEPFMMSNNQITLARRWHDSPNDIYMILRVYSLVTAPSFCVYVDPFQLMLVGKLTFASKDGYVVHVT